MTLTIWQDTEREKFTDMVHKHVKEKLHVDAEFWKKKSKAKKKGKKKKKGPVQVAPADPAVGNGEEHAPADAPAVVEKAADDGADEDPDSDELSPLYDDLVSQMDIETYIECRVRPIVDYLEGRAPVMSQRFNGLEGGYLIASTTGAVLAIIGLADWVAVSVAIASTAMALNDYFYVPAQLGATNRALGQCHNLITWWDSLSLVQRKTRAVKLQCATTVEGSLLEMCNARTAVSAALPSEAAEEEEE